MLAWALGLAGWLAGCGGAEVKPLPGGPPPEYESPRGFDAGPAGRPATAGPDEAPNNVPAPVPTDAPGDTPSPTP